jgi:DNA polymerase III alpha subunit
MKRRPAWGAIITNLRLRTIRKGEKVAWIMLADATGAIEAAVFPNAYAHLREANHGESPLREGAFVVARDRLAREEATGSKLVDSVTILGEKVSQLSALAVAIQELQPDEWSAMGASACNDCSWSNSSARALLPTSPAPHLNRCPRSHGLRSMHRRQ